MMNNDVFSIGVMSGTSLDGIDLVYVKFDTTNYQNFKILQAETIGYSKEWKQLLQNAIHNTKKEVAQFDVMYGKFLGQTIQNFISNHKIDQLDFIASHGHTILHEPDKGITLQIGAGKEIAKITNKKVVYDFRTQDVKLGGQGAPLVPIGDELLFANYDFCLNLGGFSNISFQRNQQRIAFDICPVNIVLNHYVNKLDLAYDDQGNIAASGNLNHALLEQLNGLEFYNKQPPKSLGLEWVQENVYRLIDKMEQDVPVILNTYVEHIAIQISKVIFNNDSVLVTGGGAFNTYLMQRIQFYASNQIDLVSEELINFKEALVFSFLGLLKLRDEVNCLQSVTGASKNHSSGVVILP